MLKKTVAKVIADIALKMAKASCGAASMYGIYQPKEPKVLKSLIKKI